MLQKSINFTILGFKVPRCTEFSLVIIVKQSYGVRFKTTYEFADIEPRVGDLYDQNIGQFVYYASLG